MPKRAGCGRFNRKVTWKSPFGGYLFDIAVPRFARIDAQLLTGLPEKQVPGTFDVLRRERLAVMPFDPLAQREDQLGAFFVGGPTACELRARSTACYFAARSGRRPLSC